MHIYSFYNDFSARPRYDAMFQALYFQNICIDLCVIAEALVCFVMLFVISLH